jgi:hypothetical protein
MTMMKTPTIAGAPDSLKSELLVTGGKYSVTLTFLRNPFSVAFKIFGGWIAKSPLGCALDGGQGGSCHSTLR